MSNYFSKVRLSLEYKTLGLAFILVIAVYVILDKNMNDRSEEFYDNHRLIAQNSTAIISNEIEKIFISKEKLVKIFFQDNKKSIENIIDNPEDYELYEALNTKLNRYFLDYFASNIINKEGEFVVAEFEGNHGIICQEDARSYTLHKKNEIRIHPNVTIFHYDIFLDIEVDGAPYVLIVSFNTQEIAKILKISSQKNHNLIILNKQIKNLIAVTSEGSRQNIGERGDIYITKDEQSRILSSSDINGSYWEVVDIYDATLFLDYNSKLLKQKILILLSFALLTIFMAWVIVLGVRKKHRLEVALLQKNDTITMLNQELKELSIRDSLTGVYNRHYFDEVASNKWNEAKRLKISYHMAIMDVDFFKQYNDAYGHLEGDNCLISVAQCIDKHFKRSNEFCARYGGEEFIVVSIGDEHDKFIRRLEMVMKNLKELRLEHKKSTISSYVTISIGCASSNLLECDSAENCLAQADKALYKAKESGRGRIIIAS